jgi:hypothetical protein
VSKASLKKNQLGTKPFGYEGTSKKLESFPERYINPDTGLPTILYNCHAEPGYTGTIEPHWLIFARELTP